MKYVFIILLLIVSYPKCFAQSMGFELYGHIHGIKDGAYVYLVDNTNDTLFSVRSKLGNFRFNGYVEGQADYFFIKVDSVKGVSNALWLINRKLMIEGDVSNFQNLVLIGSQPQLEYAMFENIAESTKSSDSRFAELMKSFIETHSDSYFVPYIILANFSFFQLKDKEDSYNRLSDTIKMSKYGVRLKRHIEISKLMKSEMLPDFQYMDLQGNRISVLQTASKYEYTLIDFWASWCMPCRAAIPKLRKAYENFHEKGFTILGLSTDKNRMSWEKAIKEDKTPWLHGLDNIEQASKSIFNLYAIPGYILIDKNGRIIHSDLINGVDEIIQRNKKLSKDLEEILEVLFSKKATNDPEYSSFY